MAEVVVALDHDTPAAALALADRLPGLRWAKVGATLFAAAGPAIVEQLRQRGIRVFLDLKWHDIPHQVAGVVRVARGMGVHLATVHGLGGRAMMRAAAEAARGSEMRLVAVTVLTSHGATDLGDLLGHEVKAVHEEVVRLAAAACEAGLDGVVASAEEAARIRARWDGEPVIVVPGIRLPDDAADDQRRVADPRRAVQAGGTHLVVGRSITRADDPAAVYERLLEAVT